MPASQFYTASSAPSAPRPGWLDAHVYAAYLRSFRAAATAGRYDAPGLPAGAFPDEASGWLPRAMLEMEAAAALGAADAMGRTTRGDRTGGAVRTAWLEPPDRAAGRRGELLIIACGVTFVDTSMASLDERNHEQENGSGGPHIFVLEAVSPVEYAPPSLTDPFEPSAPNPVVAPMPCDAVLAEISRLLARRL